MTLEIILTICSLCTLLGITLSLYMTREITQEPLNEMDYDPEDICIVCNEKCDNYSHWTRGG